MQITFDNEQEFNDLFYAAREAQIRFKRLRTRIYNGEHDTGIWCADDCNERIAVYKALEEKIEEQWLNQTGGVAHL